MNKILAGAETAIPVPARTGAVGRRAWAVRDVSDQIRRGKECQVSEENALSTAANDLVGQTIAERYLVLSELGKGGFGSVFMAKHIDLNNPVAIKVLHAHHVAEAENVKRFRREAEATSRLRHPAIAGVFDFGLLGDGRPYMVMEFLSGQPLSKIIDDEGAQPPERIVPLFVECCDALKYAHRKGLFHRDIKPDNIYIVKDLDGSEHAKLLDFGLAKVVYGEDSGASRLTQTGTVLGTPCYMSPEQCQAMPIDGRSDLYSLGCSLYESLAGRLPFGGSTTYEIMDAHLHRRPASLNKKEEPPAVPPALDSAVMKCLSKSPNDRFTTAEEFKQALVEACPGSGTITPVATPSIATHERPLPTPKVTSGSTKKKKKAKSNMMPVAIAAVVALAAIAGATAIWWQSAKNETATTPRRQTTPVESGSAVPGQAEDVSAQPANPAPPATAPTYFNTDRSSVRTTTTVKPAAAVTQPADIPTTTITAGHAEQPATAAAPPDANPNHPDKRIQQLEAEMHTLRNQLSEKKQEPATAATQEQWWPQKTEVPSLLKPAPTTPASTSSTPPNYGETPSSTYPFPPPPPGMPYPPPPHPPGSPFYGMPPGMPGQQQQH